MAEEPEPRRSVRSTKGQHTKGFDLLDQPPDPPKKKATKKAKQEPEEIIRCVCGATESDPSDEEPWIACDKCEAWQHNVCVGISTFDDEIPKNYLCEQCGPAAHKELLDGIKRGERIWEVRRADYEMRKQDAEEEPKKKSKRKGKRTSTPIPKEKDATQSHSANSKAKASPAPPPPPSQPHSEVKKEKKDLARSGSTKRKARDDSHDKETPKEPPAKSRKVSTAHISPRQESPPPTGPVKISDLDGVRQGPAKLIKKHLHLAVEAAIKQGVYSLSKGDTLNAKVERLTCQLEDAVYSTHPDQQAYAAQCRSLALNFKNNQELCNGLLSREPGSYTPSALAAMNSDDMQSMEKKEETAKMKALADKQAIMVSDDGPRIRRTHKGEEIIEDDNALPSDGTTSTSRRRSKIDPNGKMAARSRENSYTEAVELPENINTTRSGDDIRSKVTPKQPLNIDTKPQPTPVRKASTSDNFDINKVFSSVQSPTSASHIRRPSTFLPNAPPVNGPGVDADIDKMLQDDVVESPPYSPAEYDDDPEIIWRGSVTMDSIAKFPGTAKHVGGADVSKNIPWSDVLQKDLRIAGRIDQEKANEYLCSLRYSPPTDVIVVNVTPQGEAATMAFNELFDYFQSRGKYGVLANKGVGNIRDTYLVPVPPSPANLPDFITNLDGQRMPEVRGEKMIVIALVIKNDERSAEVQSPGLNRGTQSPGVLAAQNHAVQGHAQRQMSASGMSPNMSPIPPQGGNSNPFSASPQQQQQNVPTQSVLQGPPLLQGPLAYPPQQQQVEMEAARRRAEEERIRLQREGEARAVHILGEFVNAPTVAFLMPQAFQMRDLEWGIIRGILEGDERARGDLQHLSQVLEVRMAGEGENSLGQQGAGQGQNQLPNPAANA